jgi:hypothetical protein
MTPEAWAIKVLGPDAGPTPDGRRRARRALYLEYYPDMQHNRNAPKWQRELFNVFSRVGAAVLICIVVQEAPAKGTRLLLSQDITNITQILRLS